MITSISLENLTIHTKKGKQSQVLVKDVSISVPQGTILGIVGESGSGKKLDCQVDDGHCTQRSAGNL